MAMSNRDRVGRGLELLRTGLEPFVRREMQAVYKQAWLEAAQQALARSGSSATFDPQRGNADVQALLILMRELWRDVFGKKLGQFERNLVHELLTTRNDWAHQKPFSPDDALRALDSIHRLLVAISAPEAAEVERLKQEQIRVQYEAQPRREARRAGALPLGVQLSDALRPWREVITPIRT